MRLRAAATSEFNDLLYVSSIETLDSGRTPFIQLADLFIGSINRTINNPGSDRTHAKDRFATEFLRRFGGQADGIKHPELGDLVFIDRV